MDQISGSSFQMLGLFFVGLRGRLNFIIADLPESSSFTVLSLSALPAPASERGMEMAAALEAEQRQMFMGIAGQPYRA